MKTIDDIKKELDALSLELVDAVDDPGCSFAERRALMAASAQCASACVILDATLDAIRGRAVTALEELCRCGHDKGDHLVMRNGPGGACEHMSEETDDAGSSLVDPCSCRAFVSTVRALFPRADTSPPSDAGETDRPHALTVADLHALGTAAALADHGRD
jgi:hypothetical protein